MKRDGILKLVEALRDSEDRAEKVEKHLDRAHAARMDREHRTPKYMALIEGALRRARCGTAADK